MRGAVAVDILALRAVEGNGLHGIGRKMLVDPAKVAKLSVHLYGDRLALLQGLEGAFGVPDLGLAILKYELDLSASWKK
jgi:hypothetical protein